MEKKYRYMARMDKQVPWLIRVSSGVVESFDYPGKWERDPGLESDLRYGHGSSIDYDYISDEQAAKILKMNQDKYAKLQKEKGK